MEEEPGENQEKDTDNDKSTDEDSVKTGEQHKKNTRRYDDTDGWIVVSSKNRPGFYYDFHVRTGESHWRDQAVKKIEPGHGDIKSSKEIPFCGFEPTEPTDDPPASDHDTPSAAPKIYNKQIINNQFPFGNAPYAQSNNTAWSMPSPMIYPFAVPPQVLINSTPFHQAQTFFGPLPSLNSTVPTLNQAQTTGFGSMPNLPLQNIGPFNTTTLSQAQAAFGSMPNLPGQNLSGPFNTPLNQAETVVGPLPNMPGQNTLASVNSTMPTLSQAQICFDFMPNVPVQNLSGPSNTPLNQAETVVPPLSNLPVQNSSASVNSTMPPISQAQTGVVFMPNVSVQNIGPFNTPPLNQAQTVVGPQTNLPVQNSLAPVNSTIPPISQAQTDFDFIPNVPVQNISGPYNTPLNQAQTVVGAPVNSTTTPLSQAQAGFEPPNSAIKNSSVTLSNRFQVLKQFNKPSKSPANSVKSRLGFKSADNFPSRNHQNYMSRKSNNPNDLRSLLSGRNRQDLNEEIKKECPAKTQTKDVPASLDEDEINPDDTDEWLEDHTDIEGKKLTVDMECIWKLADSPASREAWYIVPTAIVLLNNIRFFTSLVISDKRARLLAPLSVVRTLRSATFADNARVADCAKRAMTLIRQSSKHPDTPKNLPNVSSCLELVDQNKLVVLLFDEKDKERREIINDIPKFTIEQLKQYLVQNSAANAIAAIQKIENITIVVPNKEDETQSVPSDRTVSQRIQQRLVPNNVPETQCILRDTMSHRIEASPLPIKEAETQTIPRDYRAPSPMTSEKRTVNASVQTDFRFTLLPAEKGLEEESNKSVTKMDLEVDAGEACNKDIDKKISSRKIKLKRQHQPLNISDKHEIKTFKWRRRKETSTPNSTLSQVDSCHKSYSSNSTSIGDLQHLVTQQDDKAAELEFGDVGVDVQPNDNVVEPASGDVGVDVQLNRDIVEPASSDVGVDVQLNRDIVEPASSDVVVDVQVNRDIVEPASSDVGVDVQLNRDIVEPAVSDVGDDVQLNPDIVEPAFSDVGVDAQLNDNVVEPAFSDVGVNTNTVDETSTSNSTDSYGLFQMKQAILEYEVTSEFMKEHLKSRCDEWVSRFTQIMEEVLTQVLLMAPAYEEKGLPPPWTVQEATSCIKQKLRSHTIIVNASDKFDDFLCKMSDDRGNTRTDIRPEDFMQMYSYGVNLVNVLQMVLKHEDLQIASESLSQLLKDIQEPNWDLPQEFEPCDAGSPNISESITNMSITDAPASNNVPAVIESPQQEEKRSSSNNSPARYSLRSSQRSSRAHNKQEDKRTEVVCDGKNDAAYSLFSSLGLQKKKFKPDTSIVKTIINVPQHQTHQTSLTKTDLAPDNIQKRKGYVEEPKIIRNFNIPNIENKLSDMNNVITEVDYALREEYVPEDYGLAEDVDFTKDETIEYEPEGKSSALNLAVYIATYEIHRYIMITRQFCEDTYNNLKSVEYWDPHYKADVIKKTTKASVHLQNVCDNLKRILDRDPSVTKEKFRIVMTELGSPGDMNDSQLADYQTRIKKYLKYVSDLRTFVTVLDAAIKKS